MSELVQVPNFNLNKQVWFYGPNLSKKSISGPKQKKCTVPSKSEESNMVTYKISASKKS